MAGKTIILPEVTLAFTQNLFTPGVPPNAQAGAKARRNCRFIIPTNSTAHQIIKEAIKEIAMQEWKENGMQILKNIAGNSNRCCFLDGNTVTDKNGKPYEGFAGNWALSGLRYPEKGPIIYLDRNRNPITEEAGLLYGGAIVNTKVDLFTYESPARGVGCAIQVVQFNKHGKAFGGGSVASADGMEDLGDLPFEDETTTAHDDMDFL